jgi:two-component system chemotaxis sensor kinase CheA
MAYSLGEYQDIFLEEADEQLQELNQNLLHLEKVPDDVEVINNIFRAAHSLKSSAAFVGLNDLSDLAHNMENLLQGIRDKTLQADPQVIEVLFNCFDVISGVIDEVASGKKPEADLASIIQRIKRVSGGAQAPAADVRPSRRTEPHDHEPRTALSAAQVKMIRDGLKSGQSCCEVSIFIEPSAQMKWIKAQLILKNLAATGKVVTSMPPEDSLTEETVKDVIRAILLTDRTADW